MPIQLGSMTKVSPCSSPVSNADVDLLLVYRFLCRRLPGPISMRHIVGFLTDYNDVAVNCNGFLEAYWESCIE